MLTFARAEGTTAFTASSTGSTSMPVTVSAGPDQRRSPSPPVPMNGMPVLDLRELAELLVRERRAGPLLASESVHGDVAVLVVHRRERAEHGEERVGRRAAELARVLRACERPHLDGDDAPSREGRS